MRLCVRDADAVVGVAPAGSVRPVRLRIGGIAFAMSTDEAVELATRLADIATELRNLERINHV